MPTYETNATNERTTKIMPINGHSSEINSTFNSLDTQCDDYASLEPQPKIVIIVRYSINILFYTNCESIRMAGDDAYF